MTSLISAAVIIILGLLSVLFPYNSNATIGKIKYSQKKYALMEFLAFIPIFSFLGLFTFASAEISYRLYDLIHEVGYHPIYVFWIFPGMILGMGLLLYPMEALYKIILKDEYINYLHYTNRKHGFDGMRIMKPVFKILTIIGISFFILAINTTLNLTKTSFVYNGILSLQETETKFEDISEIIIYNRSYAPNGNLTEKRQFVIVDSKGEVIFESLNNIFGIDETFISEFTKRVDIKVSHNDVKPEEI